MSDQSASRIGQVYTLAEAARLTGASVDALRQRIKRGTLETVKGNDARIRVRLMAADLEESSLAATSQVDQTKSRQADLNDQTINVLQDHVASLRELVASADGEAAALRLRISQVELEREALRQEREDARVRTAAAEGEAKALREALAEARRPAWRRWMGLP